MTIFARVWTLLIRASFFSFVIVSYDTEGTMKNSSKTRSALIEELASLRRRIGELEQSEAERRQTEEALRESESRYRLLVDQSLLGILILQDERIMYANDMITEKCGYSADELMALLPIQVMALIHPDDREVVWNRMLSRFRGNKEPERNECRFVVKDGSIYWADVHTNVIEYLGKSAIQMCIVDISERKRAYEELQFRNVLLSTQQEASIDGILVVDEKNRILTYNSRFVEMWGLPEKLVEDRLDEPVLQFVTAKTADPPSFARKVQYLYSHRQETSQDEILLADGRVFDRYSAPMVGPDDRYYGRVWYFHDITGHKRAAAEKEKLEAQLFQAQKMESVGRLAGGVAHDYNNILSVILGYTELALGKTSPDDPLHDDLQEILIAARRSIDITRQLLAFARKQTIAPKVLDLNEALEAMLKMLRQLIGEDIDLAWLPGSNPCLVKMDPSQLDQILANLCVNAQDAIAGVGKITIETGKVIFDAAYCADHAGFVPGKFSLLAVSDNGQGMDKEILGNLFEPFFTTKDMGKGTGLGLATVYGIVKQNDGFINVYSEPGKGTTFRIYLPYHSGEAEAVRTEIAAEISRGAGETVLIVEDEASILKLAHQVLDGLGYRAITARTLDEVMALAKEHTDNIDLLITDVVMPGINGRNLSDRLQALYPGLKTLFMSGYTANVIAHHGVLDEGVNFVQKPFSRKDLAAKVRAALDTAKI